MTERITPLPWKLNKGMWYPYVTTEENKGISYKNLFTFAGTDRNPADAEYVVHACNTLPHIEALNTDMLKLLIEINNRALLANAGSLQDDVKVAIQKAKALGGVNG